MSVRELAAESFLRARRIVSRSIDRITEDREAAFISDAALQRALSGKSVADIVARVKERREPHLLRGFANIQQTAAAIKSFFPHAVDESRREADGIVAHRLTLFEHAYHFGPQIDWHSDPGSQVSWPVDHFTRVPLVMEEGADVRVVWELNRLQHFTTLGRAYALTGDERYVEEFLLQLAQWYEANPPRFGVNWTVAMEAAIRAVNIIAALE